MIAKVNQLPKYSTSAKCSHMGKGWNESDAV